MQLEEITRLEDLIRNLKRARDASDLSAVQEIVRSAVASRPFFSGPPYRTAVLHEEEGLFVLQMVLAPGESVIPHEHGTWSVVGIYSGREENVLYKRVRGRNQVELAGAINLGERQVAILGPEAIHSVRNPGREPTVTLYVYGADLLSMELSQWAPPAFVENRFRYGKDGRMVDLR